ncbi:MAG: ATP-binding cassette domain-containing protein [bacterium]
MCPETPVLEVRDLRKCYGGKPVLEVEKISFDASSITAFQGPNGAGKSTLLRILACLDHPERGEVKVGGKKLLERGDWFQARKIITMVAQNPYAFRGSVFANVAFGLKARGMKKGDQEERVERALAEVGLAGTGHRRAGTLSGGELQRMAIARAMVCDPRVLVLDEPTAHVDSGSVRGIEKTVSGLRDQRGTSIILATHDSSQAFRIADRVFPLEDGTVREGGSTIVEGSLKRQENALIIQLKASVFGLSSEFIGGMELLGDFCILTLDRHHLRVRVPPSEVEAARPVPGEAVRLEPF